jgi:hypothetical protein
MKSLQNDYQLSMVFLFDLQIIAWQTNRNNWATPESREVQLALGQQCRTGSLSFFPRRGIESELNTWACA